MNYEFDVYTRNGLKIDKGKGAYVWDSDGNRYLDFYGGHAVAILGHCHPSIVHALTEQVQKLTFQTNAVDVTVRKEACKALANVAPQGLDRVFLVNSGAEANENALRIAIHLTGRKKVVALEGGFHGRTAAAGNATHGSSWYAFPGLPFEVEHVPVNDLQALHRALTNDVACLIAEPVQGLAGAIPLTNAYLQEARNLCSKVGAMFIADEVQSGMGRTGKVFAIEHSGVVPDLLTVGKGLAGGFPAGAVLAPSAIAKQIPKGFLGTTFGGGPLACACILATLNALTPALLECVPTLETAIREKCLTGDVTEIQGKGLLLGLHTKRPAKQVLAELRTHGILAGDAKDPNVVRLLPPLTIEPRHIDTLASSLQEVAAKEVACASSSA